MKTIKLKKSRLQYFITYSNSLIAKNLFFKDE